MMHQQPYKTISPFTIPTNDQLKHSIYTVFDHYDSNHDGYLDETEIKKLMTDEFHRLGLPPSSIEAALTHVSLIDANGDRVLSKD